MSQVFSVPLAGRYPTTFQYHLDTINTSLPGNSQQQHLMLDRRHHQQQQNTWKLLVVSLMNVLSVGVPLARNCHGDDYLSIWSPLGSVLEEILFPKKFVYLTLFKTKKKIM